MSEKGLKQQEQKSKVIEHLFEQRWNKATVSLSSCAVTLEDVGRAIDSCRVSLSKRNLANFFKDFIRVKRSANRRWPKSVWDRGFTATQTTGGGLCFRFVPAPTGMTEPFPNVFVPSDELIRNPHKIQSVSLPTASRRLGRADETWLAQIAVRLRLIETHFAIFSGRRVIQVDHLQMGLKLARAEIDALFLMQEGDPLSGETTDEILVYCEAKGMKDDILEDQILNGVKALGKIPNIKQERIVPIAIKTLAEPGRSLVYLIEFQEADRATINQLETLTPVNQQVYEIVPQVPGLARPETRPKDRRSLGTRDSN
jgi:hypothetical protein